MAKAGLCRIGSPSGDEMKTKNNGRKQEQQTTERCSKTLEKERSQKNPPHRDPGPRSRTFLRSRCLSRWYDDDGEWARSLLVCCCGRVSVSPSINAHLLSQFQFFDFRTSSTGVLPRVSSATNWLRFPSRSLSLPCRSCARVLLPSAREPFFDRRLRFASPGRFVIFQSNNYTRCQPYCRTFV